MNILTGKKGEQIAEQFLKKKGYSILKRNYRTPVGEIDLICLEKETLIFVEVKTNQTNEFGLAQERVHPKKQKQIIKTAWMFLKEKEMLDIDFRFDVIGVDLSNPTCDKIEHIENAFDGNQYS